MAVGRLSWDDGSHLTNQVVLGSNPNKHNSLFPTIVWVVERSEKASAEVLVDVKLILSYKVVTKQPKTTLIHAVDDNSQS